MLIDWTIKWQILDDCPLVTLFRIYAVYYMRTTMEIEKFGKLGKEQDFLRERYGSIIIRASSAFSRSVFNPLLYLVARYVG